MTYQKACILFWGLLAYIPILASPPDTLTLTLEKAIERALQQNLQLQQDALSIKTAQVNLDEAKSNLLPALSGVSRYNYNVGRSVNPVTNDFTDQPVRSQDYGLSASLTLYDGWRNIRTIQQGKDGLQLAGLELATSRRQTVLTVIQAYLEVLTRRTLWKEAQQRIVETDQELQHTERLVEVGEVSPTNLTQLKAQRAEEQLTMVRYHNDWQLAQVQLRQLLFLSADQPVALSAPVVEQTINYSVPLLTTLYQHAQLLDPALQGASINQMIAERAIKMARGAHLPTVRLTLGGYSSYSDNPPPFLENYTYARQLDFNLRKFVGLEMSIPIYNQGQIRAGVQRATIDRQRADLSQLQAQQRLWETLETAYRNTQSALKEYEAAIAREAAAEEAFRSTTTQFNLGVIDVISYSQVKSQRNEATAVRIQARYRALFFQKILAFYQDDTFQ